MQNIDVHNMKIEVKKVDIGKLQFPIPETEG